MPPHLPIACTLEARDLAQRLADMAELGHDALIEARLDGTCARLRFAAGAGVRARVETIVAAESQCCAFLQMRVSDERDAVLLTIDAPDDAGAVVDELVAAFGTPAAGRAVSSGARQRVSGSRRP